LLYSLEFVETERKVHPPSSGSKKSVGWSGIPKLSPQTTGVQVQGASSKGSSQVQGEAQIAQAMVSCAFHQVFWYINKRPQRDAKMNTKKAATNKNSFSFEESARRGNVDFIFYGIHNFKFIDHLSQDGKDLTPPFFPPGRDGSCGPSEIGVQLGAGGPGAGSSKQVNVLMLRTNRF
jgi:hypothetical protein